MNQVWLDRSAGLTVSYADFADPDAVAAAITPQARMLWIETPTNPLLKLADLEQALAGP